MGKEHHINGYTNDGFETVAESFKSNFKSGWENVGAAFAVYYKGNLVVDLWGGYADKSCRRMWREDTITTIFSCTKSIASICVAMLVERGLCDYSDKVIKFWPEFSSNGKDDITIEMILAHKAGVPYFTPKLELADIIDGDRMSRIIEEEAPKFEPGSKTAYHPLTFGWLVDQDFTIYNNPDTRIVGQPGVNGIASARALAHVHQLVMEGSIISKDMLNKLSKPLFENEFDHTIGEIQNKGHGFMYTKSPTGSWQIGHMGVGGQVARMDPENNVVLAYLTNGLKAGTGEHVFTYNRLERKIYDCIEKLRE
uniref:Beta-lactamase domain-containing protein n=1 Tax=Heterorhabditis bacteriophora TaxID=37862 RepID=A0A1I7XUP7_HETBA